MKEIIITKNEDGYKLRKVCANYLGKAPASFIYKMLRKKNIVLNDKKADAEAIVKTGDSIKLYLSDETISKFSSEAANKTAATSVAKANIGKLQIIYEDKDFIFCNKPVNVLSQKSSKDDYSINEAILDYLREKGELTDESIKTFKPSVCNRLDRNTSGIILAGKSSHGSRYLSEVIRNRSLKKYYIAIVSGKCDINGCLTAYLSKDSKTNKVDIRSSEAEGYNEIKTDISLLDYDKKEDISLLKIELITGKSHQIRAHLSYLGYPIIGDIKYGNKKTNDHFKDIYKVKHQLLSAYEVLFPEGEEAVSGKSYYAALPEIYGKVFNDLEAVLDK